MKKKILALALLSMVCLLGCGVFTAVAKSEAPKINVLFLHDTHSHLNEFTTVEDGKTEILGGFAKIKTLINQEKEKNPEPMILDAGDFSMGTLIQVIYEEEASEIRMLGELGVDVSTFGNHEYDYKAKGLANMLRKAKESGDPLPAMVVCNVDWDTMESVGLTQEQKLLKEAFDNYGVEEYTVLNKNGVKIAVTGVFGEDCLDCVPDCPLAFKNPIAAVKDTVTKIKRNEDVDMIVCVSHSGTWEKEEQSEDENIAKKVPELDIIISGHSHTKMEEPIQHGDTYIVSAGEYGKYLGSFSMEQKKDGRWKLEDYELITVDKDVEADPETQNKIDTFMSVVDSKYLSQFGYTKDQVLCTNEVKFANSSDTGSKHTEINLGSIMADAYTYAVPKMSDDDKHPVDVSVVPSGVIRDSYAIGNITTESVFHSFSLGIGEDGIPGYPLISVYLTGTELKIAAEIDASISDLMTSARLYTDGLYWNFNPNRMILNKVTDVYLCDENEKRVEIEDDKLYRVVTDFYTLQMLGGVTDLSYGLLSVVPKFADGTPVEKYEDAIIKTKDGKELKAWVAIAEYMTSFEDTDNDGIGNVPAKYSEEEGRKVVEDSKNPLELVKNPNKFFFGILAIVFVLLAILVGLIVVIVKVVKHIIIKKK